ncbi:lysylphosphatidylglycerol synthase transmembrane domain-containing protein [Albidovulum sp.]|uniref:lysylphosphatidylglycerol synthase transmembrane domain-containing protein n=1 Tax=Albidovulum sp. TaxID=1872424 RepID=UPI0039B9BE2C
MAIPARALKTWAIRAAGSAVALALIFWFLPKEAILQGFTRLSLPLFLTVLAVFLLCHLATATKWWLLMDRAIPLATALRAHFAGLAANLCLPGAAGGDAVRAGLAHASLRDGPKVAAAAVGDRMIDLVGLACLTLWGLAVLGGQGANRALALAVSGFVFALAVAGLFLFPAIARSLWGRWPGLPAKALALRVADAFAALGRRPLLLLFTLVLSAAIQSVLIWLSVKLAEPVGVHVPLAAWFFAWPLAKIIATLPISLGGLGVRESSLAALLVPFGAGAPEVVASGLAWQGILYLAGALGAILLVASGGALRAAVPRTITEISE